MKSLHGLTRTLIHNMIIGVTEGYRRSLKLTVLVIEHRSRVRS